MRLLAIIIIVIFISGCTREKCKDVIEEYSATETIIDKIPINVTSTFGFMEPRIVERHIKIPLNYSLTTAGSSVVKWPIGNESSLRFDYGRLDQNVTAYFYVILKNTDSRDGNFTIVGKVVSANRTKSKSETVSVNQGETKKVEFEFDLLRGRKWKYGIEVIPEDKITIVSEIVEEYSNEPMTFVEYEYVKRTIEVTKNRTVRVC